MNVFSEYKDAHKGESCVFYGCGPTIKEFNKSNVPSSFLKFGVNETLLLDLDLDYWFMGDSNPQDRTKFWDKLDLYRDYQPALAKFVRVCKWAEGTTVYLDGIGNVPRNGQLPLDMPGCKYYEAIWGGDPQDCKFKKDISNGPIVDVASISFEVLQFILFTGIKKIYLVGHDCNYSKGTFTGCMVGQKHNAGMHILNYWKVIKDWIAENYPEVEIFSVNPVELTHYNEVKQEDIE
tara:strand:- start:1050 stop:1754 length:705 start_codon:yes stop_codon:yes gene_type:complete